MSRKLVWNPFTSNFDYVDSSANDILETSFSLTNNQSSPADVTGFLFNNSAVRAFEVLASVTIIATASTYESFKLYGIQKGSSWEMSQSATGDISGVVFTITTAGQVQYTSTNNSGFASGTIKFRAITLSV